MKVSISKKNYPKTVKPCDVVNSIFGSGLFMVAGGHTKYDEVWMKDGGKACYLCRIDTTEFEHLKIIRRWISWDTKIIQLYEVTSK